MKPYKPKKWKRQRRQRGSDKSKSRRKYRANPGLFRAKAKRNRAVRKNSGQWKIQQKKQRSRGKRRRRLATQEEPQICFEFLDSGLRGYIVNIFSEEWEIEFELEDGSGGTMDVEEFLDVAALDDEEDEDQLFEILDQAAWADPEEVDDEEVVWSFNSELTRVATRVAMRHLARHSRRLYHGTSSVNLKMIRSNGLRSDPARRLFETEVDRPMEGHLYLTPNPGVAGTYAGRAASKFGGDPMVLVFHFRPDDPRFVSDEDWIGSVRSFLIEAGIPWYSGDLVLDLNNLWALADGTPDWIRGTKYGSVKHLEMLVDINSILRMSRKFSDVLSVMNNVAKGETSRFALGIAEDLHEAGGRAEADKLTRKVRAELDKALHQLAPHPWVPVERIALFILDPFILKMASDPAILGKTRREAWEKHRDMLERKWPEWFSQEAALVSQHQGKSRAVAIKAPTIKPQEAWVIDRPGRITSYQDLGRLGKQVYP